MKAEIGFITVIKKIDSFFNFLSKICFVFSAVIILATCLMILAGVINRTFIGAIWLFVEEYATFALLPMSYAVYGYVLRQNRHLKLDIIFNKMPYKVRIALAIFSGVVTLVVCVFMLMAAGSFMQYQIDSHVVSTGGTKTPLWIFSLTIVIGIALFAIDLIFYIINEIINMVTGEEPLKFEQKIKESVNSDVTNSDEFVEAIAAAGIDQLSQIESEGGSER